MSRNPNPSNSNKHCIMNKSRNVALAIVLGGTASLALAQSPKESFADTFARMQSLSSNSSNWQRDKPVISNVPKDPIAGLSIREMQALSSDSPGWQIDQGKVEFDHGPTFAQTHPHGLSFSQYQAYASNSGEFTLPPNADVSSFAATGTVTVAGRTGKPTLRKY
ncbi:MAG TPA: hypothetical protein VGL25_15040 [Casimicrobiaceae bacterium]|jgi:hypothetical protein